MTISGHVGDFSPKNTEHDHMIHVAPQPEPVNFDDDVHQPGLAFLHNTPNPSTREWNSHSYWRNSLSDLYNAYNGICAYSCHWIPFDTGNKNVEHFLPKKYHPDKAYDWQNYRLVCGMLNGRKGTKTIIDPFLVQDGWFIIDFPSLLVKCSPDIRDVAIKSLIKSTITILKLNDEGSCLKSRAKYVEAYCKSDITFSYLCSNAPFISHELQRQNLIEDIRRIMIY